MKKILIVITKAGVGGAQMSVLNLARELKNRGNEVLVGFGDGDFLSNELNLENIPYTRFKWLKRTHNPLANLFFVFEMNKFLKEKDIDTVHFNSSNALFGAIGAKSAGKSIKTVFTFRGMSMIDDNYQKNKIMKIFYFFFFKFMMKFIDAPVFVSRENLKKSQRDKLTDKGILVYNGLSPEKLKFYQKDEARSELKMIIKKDLSGKYIIGGLGRLDYAKNFEFLIDNFRDILKIKPEAVAVIIGEGSERKRYEELTRQRGLGEKIFFPGSISNASRFLPGFDLLVSPSRYEGLSITLLEVLFSGIPALASDVGGNREVFLTDNELYELDNREEFLQKFKRLQYEEVILEVLEKNSVQAKKFNIKNTAGGYEEIY